MGGRQHGVSVSFCIFDIATLSCKNLRMIQKNTHDYPFFTHRSCEFFPCHEGVDPDDFNCLFCYCPLYALGPECGGDFTYTKKGVKNCKACSLPHKGDAGTRYVKSKFPLLAALAAHGFEEEPSNE